MGAPVIRFEIGCKDSPSISAFYQKAFGWSLTPGEFTTEVDTHTAQGIPGAITALGHEPHQYVTVYIEVPDIAEACENIVALGGAVTVGPVDIPGDKGRFAWFTDPESNMLALFEAPKK